MQKWKRVEPTVIHKVGYRTIVTKHFIRPDGQVGTYDSVNPEGENYAAVIALTPENKVIIARQFRFGPEKVMEDLPAGVIDKNETPEETVRRELTEETGYAIGDHIEYIGQHYRSAYMNSTTHYFLATNCVKKTDQKLDDDEFIEVDLITIDQLFYNAGRGRMLDLGAVFLAHEQLLKLKGQT